MFLEVTGFQIAMTTFGFSAFLKLVSLSGRAQRYEMSKRLKPRDGGYDFHKATRRICGRFLSGDLDFDSALSQAQIIIKESERKSAVGALEKLAAWRETVPGTTFRLGSQIYESPRRIFKVRFDPDFGIEISGRRTAVHLWNTKKPPLDARMSRAAMSLFSEFYEDQRLAEFAILDLRLSRIVRLSDDSSASIVGANVIDALEDIFDDLRVESPRPGAEDRPPAPQ